MRFLQLAFRHGVEVDVPNALLGTRSLQPPQANLGGTGIGDCTLAQTTSISASLGGSRIRRVARAGDPIVELHRDPRGFRVTEIARLYARDRDDVEAMRRATELDVLPKSWRDYFRRRIDSVAT